MDEVRLLVRVQPGARQDAILGFAEGTLRVRVAASAERGRANEALIAFLASRLGVRKDQVAILRGQHSRSKLVAITGLPREEVMRRLAL